MTKDPSAWLAGWARGDLFRTCSGTSSHRSPTLLRFPEAERPRWLRAALARDHSDVRLARLEGKSGPVEWVILIDELRWKMLHSRANQAAHPLRVYMPVVDEQGPHGVFLEDGLKLAEGIDPETLATDPGETFLIGARDLWRGELALSTLETSGIARLEAPDPDMVCEAEEPITIPVHIDVRRPDSAIETFVDLQVLQERIERLQDEHTARSYEDEEARAAGRYDDTSTENLQSMLVIPRRAAETFARHLARMTDAELDAFVYLAAEVEGETTHFVRRKDDGLSLPPIPGAIRVDCRAPFSTSRLSLYMENGLELRPRLHERSARTIFSALLPRDASIADATIVAWRQDGVTTRIVLTDRFGSLRKAIAYQNESIFRKSVPLAPGKLEQLGKELGEQLSSALGALNASDERARKTLEEWVQARTDAISELERDASRFEGRISAARRSRTDLDDRLKVAERELQKAHSCGPLSKIEKRLSTVLEKLREKPANSGTQK